MRYTNQNINQLACKNSYQQNTADFRGCPTNCQTKTIQSFRRFSSRQGWPGWRRAAEEALASSPSLALMLGIGVGSWGHAELWVRIPLKKKSSWGVATKSFPHKTFHDISIGSMIVWSKSALFTAQKMGQAAASRWLNFNLTKAERKHVQRVSAHEKTCREGDRGKWIGTRIYI